MKARSQCLSLIVEVQFLLAISALAQARPQGATIRPSHELRSGRIWILPHICAKRTARASGDRSVVVMRNGSETKVHDALATGIF